MCPFVPLIGGFWGWWGLSVVLLGLGMHACTSHSQVGTFPAGSTWRLNPIPACACDWGRGCNVAGTNPMQKVSP